MTVRKLVVSALLATLLWPDPAQAARSALPAQQVKLNALIRDTQKNNISNQAIEVVWWIPPEYWKVSLSQQADVTPAMREQFEDAFSDYNIIAVVQGAFADDMQYRYTDEDEVRSSTRLIDATGTTHNAMDIDDIPPKLASMLAFLKPVLASSMGPMGKSMYFIVFPGNNLKGDRLVDPLADGHVQVKTRDNTYAFRLPLGSLLPDQVDSSSGESFPGDYLYNPYTGAALKAAKPR